jgi:hypothetical protein
LASTVASNFLFESSSGRVHLLNGGGVGLSVILCALSPKPSSFFSHCLKRIFSFQPLSETYFQLLADRQPLSAKASPASAIV